MSSPPIERRVKANGISLTVFEWGRELRGQGSPLFLAHATGFHARIWDRVVQRLGARHVFAVDQRGHGRSDKPLPVHWQDFGQDLAAVVRALEVHDVVGVGHSMGGHAITEAAAAEPGRFRRLVLIDPVIAAPGEYSPEGAPAWQGEAHPALKRRNHFASPDEMFERFKDRPPFDTFDRNVLRDHCQYGLVPDPSGDGFVLACPPEFEASVYMASRANAGVLASASNVDVPVLVLRMKEPPPERSWMDFRSSPTWPGLAQAFQRGREVHLTDRTHFLPMEDPALTARYILADD